MQREQNQERRITLHHCGRASASRFHDAEPRHGKNSCVACQSPCDDVRSELAVGSAAEGDDGACCFCFFERCAFKIHGYFLVQGGYFTVAQGAGEGAVQRSVVLASLNHNKHNDRCGGALSSTGGAMAHSPSAKPSVAAPRRPRLLGPLDRLRPRRLPEPPPPPGACDASAPSPPASPPAAASSPAAPRRLPTHHPRPRRSRRLIGLAALGRPGGELLLRHLREKRHGCGLGLALRLVLGQ